MKVLIVRLSAMGDVIHAMPAVAGLRAAIPDSVIDWAIEERWMPLLSSRPPAEAGGEMALSPEQPLVNAVHPVHMRRWRNSLLSRNTLHEIGILRHDLRELQYEVAIDLQGAIRSSLLAKASRARVRAGALQPRELPARWWYNVKAHTTARHVIVQACQTISAAVGRTIDPSVVAFPSSAHVEKWTNDLLQSFSAPFAIVNPGAGWGAKCWPVERYAALVKNLVDHGVGALVNAGPGELQLAQAVCAGMGKLARVVECSLLELIALTRRAAIFVGGDTGPLHLASALGVPVVAIFGPTDPARNGPYGGRFIVLRSPESKRDHSRRSEPEAGLLNISVEQVSEAALNLLGVTV